MIEHDRPETALDPALRSPSAETLGEVLDRTAYADLYRLVEGEGLPYFARLNGEGDVELYLVFESVDAFSEATRDAVSIEFKTYKEKLLAVLWTLHDPQNPLGFPLSFAVQDPAERRMALRLIVQGETPVHYLAFTDGQIIHIYTETITFSEAERRQAEGYVRRLLAGEPRIEAEPAEGEVAEEELSSIPAAQLSDQLLQEGGVAYLFAYRRMKARYGEEEAQHLLMNTLRQAILVMRRHARSDVRESSFTVWAGEREDTLALYITPDLYTLFDPVHHAEETAHPFTRFLLALPDFLEVQEGVPLLAGAFPILRYDAGKLFHLELDEAFQHRLARLFARMAAGNQAANPYAGHKEA